MSVDQAFARRAAASGLIAGMALAAALQDAASAEPGPGASLTDVGRSITPARSSNVRSGGEAQDRSREQDQEALRDDEQDEAEETAGLSAGTDGIRYRSADGRLQWYLGGRIHLDAGGGEGRGDLDETSLWRTRIRRARLEFSTTVDRYWHGDANIELADRDQPVKELLVGYAGDRFALTLGNFKEPFGLEHLTSSNDLAFLERSLADALVPGRNAGLGISLDGERWTAMVGVFGGNINERVDRQGVGVTGRLTYAPIKEDEHVLHVGASASFRALERRQEIEFASTPESRVYDVSVVGFDPLDDARDLSRFGLEGAYIQGPLRAQSEYVLARVDRQAAPAAHFHGGYILISYMLTGETQQYALAPDRRRGTGYAVFDGIDLSESDRISRGGSGAWEVAARYSVLDLNSESTDGGRLQNISAALNWYPETNIRLMTNYTRAMADRLDEDDPTASVDIFQVRLQIAF